MPYDEECNGNILFVLHMHSLSTYFLNELN